MEQNNVTIDDQYWHASNIREDKRRFMDLNTSTLTFPVGVHTAVDMRKHGEHAIDRQQTGVEMEEVKHADCCQVQKKRTIWGHILLSSPSVPRR